jgi:glycosyltransferase involved in cell wall biosynthesis
MPRVSVVVPAFNAAPYIGETLASVAAQTLDDWKLTVVDDGSTDDSAAIAARWAGRDARMRLLRQPNRGTAAARNAGFAASDTGAEYLMFLDADDCLEPSALEVMAAYLDRHSEIGMVHSSYTLIDSHGRGMEADEEPWTTRWVPAGRRVSKLRREEPGTPFVSVFCLAVILPSTTLFRRSAYCLTPAWDEEFGEPFGDTNLFLHMALVSNIHHIEEPLVRHRRHDSQMTAHLDKLGSQERKLYERWRDPAGLTDAQREIVRTARRFRERKLIPAQAFAAARRHARERRPLPALRFLVGGARRWRP